MKNTIENIKILKLLYRVFLLSVALGAIYSACTECLYGSSATTKHCVHYSPSVFVYGCVTQSHLVHEDFSVLIQYKLKTLDTDCPECYTQDKALFGIHFMRDSGPTHSVHVCLFILSRCAYHTWYNIVWSVSY
jgi:hypothetical protein